MPEERSMAVELPKTVELPSVRLPFHVRARAGMVKPSNWFQLLRFSVVGVSGYLLNLGIFAVCLHMIGIDYRLSSVIAYVLSGVNNFWWNRHWTFDAKHQHPMFQGPRFVLVSLLTYGFTYILLVTLVSDVGLMKLPAQAIAVAAATPLSFLGQKLWTYRA
jgi:dolichol-phosphate mannosyltransferase